MACFTGRWTSSGERRRLAWLGDKGRSKMRKRFRKSRSVEELMRGFRERKHYLEIMVLFSQLAHLYIFLKLNKSLRFTRCPNGKLTLLLVFLGPAKTAQNMIGAAVSVGKASTWKDVGAALGVLLVQDGIATDELAFTKQRRFLCNVPTRSVKRGENAVWTTAFIFLRNACWETKHGALSFDK